MDWLSLWGDRPLPPELLWLEVDTLAGPETHGAAFVAWLDETRSSLLVPIVERLGAPDPTFEPHNEFEWGPRGGTYVGLAAFTTSEQTITVPWSDKAWADLANQLEGGQLTRLSVEVRPLGADGAPDRDRGSAMVAVDFTGREFPGAANRVRASASRTLLGPDLAVVAGPWVEPIRRAVPNLDPLGGWISCDRVGENTAHEQSVGRTAVTGGLQEAADRIRGYAWGNLLGCRHVGTLGGIERVMEEAPGTVEPLGRPDCRLAWVQLGDDPCAVSEGDLRRLKALLAPLLAPPRPGFAYFGPPIRVV